MHSYHKGYKWSDDISLAIEDSFKYYDIELVTLYMHTKRATDDKYFELLHETYQEQFKNYNFDLVIVSDNASLEFAIKYKDTLFKNKIILFCGINNYTPNLIKGYEDEVSGVVEEVDIGANISLILKMHPETRDILIINDKSKTSQELKKSLPNVLKRFENRVNFEYIDDIDFTSLQSKVKNLPKNSAILFLLLFKDKTGKSFTYKDRLNSISKISNSPIYGLWDFYLGEGIVGGVLTSAYEQGLSVSKMAIDVLFKNKSIKDINILQKSPNRYMFDYSELIKFKSITTISLPKDAIVINLPFSFYEANKKFVWNVIIIITLFLIIITLLIINILKRQKIEEKLANQLKFLEVLLDTIPHPIVYKDITGKYKLCNRAFAKFIGKNREDIIGKTIEDFFEIDYVKLNLKKDLIAINSLQNQEYEITLKRENQNRHYLINKAVFFDLKNQASGLVSVINDITEKVKLESEREFLMQQSKLAEMGEMISAVAHQWNEPLVEISAIIQDLEFSYKTDSLDKELLDELVSDSMVQIRYMSDTLRDFKNFLKPSTQKVKFQVKKAFDEIFNIIGRQIKYLYIDLKISYENENTYIYGYENEFKQVILTILNNAKDSIKSAKESKGLKRGIISIKLFSSDNRYSIEISDNGGGVDERYIDKVFNAYFSTKKDGTGVGLYMSKVLIEDKMGGAISLYNRDNYANFLIEIPIVK